MEKKKVLFIHQSQYGYNMGSVQYVKYLKDDYDISFICWDYLKKRINEPKITVKYISRKGNKIKRNIIFIRSVLHFISQRNISFVFIHYFIGSSFISFFCNNTIKVHLDIRTGSVSNNLIKRIIFNTVMRFESHFFKSISIISEGLRDQLRISNKSYILPLGANPISVKSNPKYKLHLLYIGILTNRKIEDTIYGTSIFLKKFPLADLHYTIVGNGYFNEEIMFRDLVIKLSLQSHIDIVGYIPYNEITPYYEIANIGVSYVPITSYYEYQPVTKTYEYLMAGMPVIATQTYENKKVINTINGILINDTPESFAFGVEYLYNNTNSFNEQIIRKSVENFKWSKIIKSMKEKILP